MQRAEGAQAQTVSAQIVSEVSARNAARTPPGQWASLGFVIGATVDWTDAGLTPFTPPAPILGPGFGAQGAEPADLQTRFGATASTVIASESRSILSAGPDRLTSAIDARVEESASRLRIVPR